MSNILLIFSDFRPNWPGILILGLVLIASLYGAYLIHRLAPPALDAPVGDETHNGIGGWLILVIIGMAQRIYSYGKTALIAGGLISNSTKWAALTNVKSASYNAFWSPCLFFEACAAEIFVVTVILAFVLMAEKKFTYPFVMIGILISSLIFHIVDHVLASQITSIEHNPSAFVTLMFRLTVACIVWIPYFLVSKRVKATFRN